MEISESLKTLYSAEIVERDGEHYLTIPEREITNGGVNKSEVYRVALLTHQNGRTDETPSDTRPTESPVDREKRAPGERGQPVPVTEGEILIVEIEAIGEQGDGIAKVARGFVVIVPDTQVGQRVRVRVDDVRENVAFAKAVGEPESNGQQ